MANVQKGLVFLVSTHVAMLGFILIATVAGFSQPLLPIQILWLEVFIDMLTAAGADATMHQVAGAGHGFTTPATAWPDAEKAMFDAYVHGIPGTHKRNYRFGKKNGYTNHEAFLTGTVVFLTVYLPDELNLADFDRAMETAGSGRGISPYGWDDGYGRFKVIKTEVPRDCDDTTAGQPAGD